MRNAVVAVCTALSLSACGRTGDLPTATDGTISFTLTVRAARVPQGPVNGAVVVTDDSRTFITDSNGVVSLSPRDLRTRLRITAPGFTGPSTIVFRPLEQGMIHFLLPDDDGMPYTWIKEAFYGSNDGQWIWRPLPGRLDVSLSGEGWQDRRVPAALSWGSDRLNNAQNHVFFNIVEAGQTGEVRMYSDPTDPVFRRAGYENVWAFTAVTTNGAVVTGARVVWKYFLDAPNSALPEHIGKAMAHELGHVMGIQGHPCCGIMGSPDVLQDYSEQEKEVFGYLFLRPPGTRPPDNLASAPTATAQQDGSRETIVCILRR